MDLDSHNKCGLKQVKFPVRASDGEVISGVNGFISTYISICISISIEVPQEQITIFLDVNVLTCVIQTDSVTS